MYFRKDWCFCAHVVYMTAICRKEKKGKRASPSCKFAHVSFIAILTNSSYWQSRLSFDKTLPLYFIYVVSIHCKIKIAFTDTNIFFFKQQKLVCKLINLFPFLFLTWKIFPARVCTYDLRGFHADGNSIATLTPQSYCFYSNYRKENTQLYKMSL